MYQLIIMALFVFSISPFISYLLAFPFFYPTFVDVLFWFLRTAPVGGLDGRRGNKLRGELVWEKPVMECF
jgi:hypothetical protein